MGFLRLPPNAKFSNKFLILFALPVVFETIMVGFLGLADTFTVSFLGETAVAGVALVNRIDTFVKQFLLALGQGGCVVVSQYIGAKRKELTCESMRENVRIIFLLGLLITAAVMIFKSAIISALFGNAQPEVLDISNQYYSITVLSYPFTALYYCCTNIYRSLGKSRITMISGIVMMALNILLKYIFIFHMDMGVYGAGLSTLIAIAVSGCTLLILLITRRNGERVSGLVTTKLNFGLSWKILKVAIPNGMEQGMFQLGALAIAGIVSGLGTVAISADQIARNVSVLIYSGGSSFVAVMLMVVGRCCGADDADDAKFYTKHILKINYIYTFINAVILLAVLKPLIGIFRVSAETHLVAYQIMVLYIIGTVVLYPASFAVPAALRAAGDASFVMWASGLSMFLFRVGAAYIFAYVFKMGVIGTWVAMISDWLIRSIIFAIRYLHGKWLDRKVI